MEPKELIYNVYKNIVSIKNLFDEAIAYLKDDLGKDSSEPNYHKFQFYTKTMQFTKEEELWEAISKGSMPEIEQLEGKELLDTLEALRNILHPTVRALLESDTIDMVMPIPGIISFLLIGKSKQEIEPSTVISRIRYLMEGCIDHEPTSLLKEYHILNYERIYISHQQTQFKSKLIIL